MMSLHVLTLPPNVHAAVRQHLLPVRPRVEEAAFIYAAWEDVADGVRLTYLDWFPVPADGFASRSAHHLELSDETRGAVIKRAHDLGACLVEFHSHLGLWPARFSPSDVAGFRDFVPHVLWRLKNRPYTAVVVAKGGFDAFVWCMDPYVPLQLTAIEVGTELLKPSRLSLQVVESYGF